MTTDSREQLRDIFQLINHRLRTPLSIVVHELEHLILTGNEECRLARERALEISTLLANFSRLIDSKEARQELPLGLLLKPLLQQHPELNTDFCMEPVVTTKPRQICCAFGELVTVLQKANFTNIELRTNAAGELGIYADFSGKLSTDDCQCYHSTHDLLSRFRASSQTPAALIDSVFQDNQISFKAKLAQNRLSIILEFLS